MGAVTEDARARELDLPVDQGALVQTVEDGGPADKAGLRGLRAPRLTARSGRRRPDRRRSTARRSRAPDDVVGAIADKKPGDKIEIEYYRGDDKRTVERHARRAARRGGQSRATRSSSGLPCQLP